MTITITDILLLLITCGLLVIFNGFLVGWLVYRAKRESYETLSPKRMPDSPQGAVNLDEFAPVEESLPSAIKEGISRLEATMGVDILKGAK